MSLRFPGQPDPSGDLSDDALFAPLGCEPDAHAADEGPIPDDLVDAMLDGEVPKHKIAEVRSVIRSDAAADARLRKTQHILDLLKHTHNAATAPDMTASIMAKVERQRTLMGRFGLRRVIGLRYAAAACLALVAGMVFFGERTAPPGTLELVARPTPLNNVADAARDQSASIMQTFGQAVHAARHITPTFETVPAMATIQRGRAQVSEVPPMNPPIAAVMWIDAPSGKSQCEGRVCSSRRDVERSVVSLRSIFADDAPGGDAAQSLVAFRR